MIRQDREGMLSVVQIILILEAHWVSERGEIGRFLASAAVG
jgi:hypothetical protein